MSRRYQVEPLLFYKNGNLTIPGTTAPEHPPIRLFHEGHALIPMDPPQPAGMPTNTPPSQMVYFTGPLAQMSMHAWRVGKGPSDRSPLAQLTSVRYVYESTKEPDNA